MASVEVAFSLEKVCHLLTFADLTAEGEMQDRLSRANQPGHESAHAEMLARGFLVRLSAVERIQRM